MISRYSREKYTFLVSVGDDDDADYDDPLFFWVHLV